jgi:hypothetical protein
MVKRKLVTVADFGPLQEIGGIGGPLRTPTNIALNAICQMVVNGKTVFEHNPSNVKEKVRLTLSNVKSDNFVKSEDGEPVKTQPVKVEVTPEVAEKSIEAATSATANLAQVLADAQDPTKTPVKEEVVEEAPAVEAAPVEEKEEIDETAIDEQGVTHEEPIVQEDAATAVDGVAEALAAATSENSQKSGKEKNKNKNK